MRIIAIGIGGAGCRIVDSLYATDRRSSKVACVQGLAVDVDEKTIQQLEGLPENAKMCFSALDPGLMDQPAGGSTATIDIGEIVSRVQNFETGENDAIVFCCGLGGSMVDVAPHVIAGLRSSIVEPIFGLVTLPCLAEGERISGKAADDIEMLSTLLDGIILFDNETWYKKIKAEKAHIRTKEKGFAEKMGFKKSEKILSPAQATYNLLNQAIVRRISLILRAGEFKADGGIDLAEVVLDSGEVLNTMKGMGFITIGYAVERLPHDPLSFLSRWKPVGLFDDDQKKKASRIVELAKQAIYHEISTPCDLTSAHKALILVAGPSHELSMKGFMTVRKWIDRSIAGLETRSGDYPVMNTKNVAIIIMLSGLENIPRISELREIRAQAKSRRDQPAEFFVTSPELEEQVVAAAAIPPTLMKDEMISLPVVRKSHKEEFPHQSAVPDSGPKDSSQVMNLEIPDSFGANDDFFQPSLSSSGTEEKTAAPVNIEMRPRENATLTEPATEAGAVKESPQPSRRRVIVASEHTHIQPASHQRLSSRPTHCTDSSVPVSPAAEHARTKHQADEISRSPETERQRIERELQRQRVVAISGHPPKISAHAIKGSSHDAEPAETSHGMKKKSLLIAEEQTLVSGEAGLSVPEKKTVIPGRRKVIARQSDTPDILPDKSVEEKNSPKKPSLLRPAENTGIKSERTAIGIKDPAFRAKDAVFNGKEILRSDLPPVRDSTLIHTDLKPKKKIQGSSGEKSYSDKESS